MNRLIDYHNTRRSNASSGLQKTKVGAWERTLLGSSKHIKNPLFGFQPLEFQIFVQLLLGDIAKLKLEDCEKLFFHSNGKARRNKLPDWMRNENQRMKEERQKKG